MPRIPRDLSGTELARKLGAYGYQVTRQTGSHVRLTRDESGSRAACYDSPAFRVAGGDVESGF